MYRSTRGVRLNYFLDDVQSGHRQQAAWLRSRCHLRRGHAAVAVDKLATEKHPPLAPVLIATRAVASTLPTPCLMVGIAAGNPAQKSYTGSVLCLLLTLAGLRRPKMGFHSRNRQPQEAASAREIRHRNPSLLNL